jgi:uncharacterized membrane protein
LGTITQDFITNQITGEFYTMATLVVLKFPTADGAEAILDQIQSWQKQFLITVHDAAVVSWETGKKKPKTKQLYNMAGIGALDGAFWGLLFGLIFFMPWMGMLIGAAVGGLSGKFTDVGIDDNFINSVRDQVTEGTSALFLMTSDAVLDKLQPELAQINATVIATNLSSEAEANLQSMFASAADEE